MFRLIYTTFLHGLVAVLPVVITLYVLAWLFSALESSVGAVVQWILPDGWYQPGMGLVAGVVLIFLVGLSLRTWFIRTVWGWAESLLGRIPIIKTVYSPIKDLIMYVDRSASGQAQGVVTVSVGESMRLLGFVTRTNVTELGNDSQDERVLAVYLPMSYQIGGFTLFVPESHVQNVDMSVEEGLRFAITAGVAASERRPTAGPATSAAHEIPAGEKQSTDHGPNAVPHSGQRGSGKPKSG